MRRTLRVSFPDKSTPPLPALRSSVDQLLGPDLALRRPVNTSNVRGNTREFGGEKALDGDDKTFWATNDDARRMTLEVDMEGPVDINAALISEAVGMEQRVQQYRVEGQVDSDWKLLSEGTTIGQRKVDRFATVTAWKVRLTILKSDRYPAIRQFGLYREADQSPGKD
jgi:alpha-L-fucosidase